MGSFLILILHLCSAAVKLGDGSVSAAQMSRDTLTKWVKQERDKHRLTGGGRGTGGGLVNRSQRELRNAKRSLILAVLKDSRMPSPDLHLHPLIILFKARGAGLRTAGPFFGGRSFFGGGRPVGAAGLSAAACMLVGLCLPRSAKAA